VHVAIDDHTRIAFSAIYPDETQASVLAFLHAALAYYARLGIRFRAILTDNGPAYRSRAVAAACRALGLKHRFTRPYTPRTNGKAERFIQTALREWAYARSYQRTQTNEASSSAHGCTSTTGIDPIVVLACRHPSADPRSMTTTC
jgi:transposase InsO family protein